MTNLHWSSDPLPLYNMAIADENSTLVSKVKNFNGRQVVEYAILNSTTAQKIQEVQKLIPTMTVIDRSSYDDMERRFVAGGALFDLIFKKGSAPQFAKQIRDGACIHIKSEDGFSLLSAAIEAKRLDLVQLLIEAGADLEDEFMYEATTPPTKMTPLLQAFDIKNPQIRDDMIEALLRGKADLNKVNEKGQTYLMRAISDGNYDLAFRLVQAGIDVERADQDGVTALGQLLSLPEKDFEFELAYALLNSGAKIPKEYREAPQLYASVKDGQTLLSKVMAFDRMDIVLQLLPQVNVKTFNKTAKEPITLYKVLTSKNRSKFDVAYELLGQGIKITSNCRNFLDGTNQKGETLLLKAIKNERYDIASNLIDVGAKVQKERLYGSPPFIETPLLVVLQRLEGNPSAEDIDLAGKLLNAGAKIDPISYTILRRGAYRMVLWKAVELGQLEVVRKLIDTGIDPGIDLKGKTLLQLATDLAPESGRRENIKKELLEAAQARARVNREREAGRTDLWGYVAFGMLDKVKECIQQGVDVTLEDDNGYTPLSKELTMEKFDVEIAYELLKAGATIDKRYIDNLNRRDDQGRCLLSLATAESRKDIYDLLVEAGATPHPQANANDVDGVSFLEKAVASGNLEKVRELIQGGAFVRTSNAQGISPLDVALTGEKFNFDVAYALLEVGATINPKFATNLNTSKSGQTLLKRAVNEGNEPLAKRLIKGGATHNVPQVLIDSWDYDKIAVMIRDLPAEQLVTASQVSKVKMEHPTLQKVGETDRADLERVFQNKVMISWLLKLLDDTAIWSRAPSEKPLHLYEESRDSNELFILKKLGFLNSPLADISDYYNLGKIKRELVQRIFTMLECPIPKGFDYSPKEIERNLLEGLLHSNKKIDMNFDDFLKIFKQCAKEARLAALGLGPKQLSKFLVIEEQWIEFNEYLAHQQETAQLPFLKNLSSAVPLGKKWLSIDYEITKKQVRIDQADELFFGANELLRQFEDPKTSLAALRSEIHSLRDSFEKEDLIAFLDLTREVQTIDSSEFNFTSRWGTYNKAELVQGFEDEQQISIEGICSGITLRMQELVQSNPDIPDEVYAKEFEIRPIDRMMQAKVDIRGAFMDDALQTKDKSLKKKKGISPKNVYDSSILKKGFREEVFRYQITVDDFCKSIGDFEQQWKDSYGVIRIGVVGHTFLMRLDPLRKRVWLLDSNHGFYSFTKGASYDENRDLCLECFRDLMNLCHSDTKAIDITHLKGSPTDIFDTNLKRSTKVQAASPLNPIGSRVSGHWESTEEDDYLITGDMGKDGNCQLNSMAGILSLRYPAAYDIRNKETIVQGLRRMGVEKAREILENHQAYRDGRRYDPEMEQHYKTLIDYIQRDIEEYNDTSDQYRNLKSELGRKLRQIDEMGGLQDLYNSVKASKAHKSQRSGPTSGLKVQIMEEVGASEETLDSRINRLEAHIRLKEAELAPKKEAVEAEFQRMISEIPGIILSPDSYLERAAANKFWCGFTHLFTLSLVLDYPIQVYDRVLGSEGVQYNSMDFNPTNDKQKEPLILRRINGNHYQAVIAVK